MKQTFQDGVDSIYNAIKGQGTTPAGKTPAQLAAAIGTVATNKYNAGNSAGYTNGYNAGYSVGKANFGITVEKYANSEASAGFTGTQLVSTDKNGSFSASHGYHGVPMTCSWSTDANGVICIEMNFGGYGTVGARCTIRP